MTQISGDDFKNEGRTIQEVPCVKESADSSRVQKKVHSSKGRTIRNALLVGFCYFLSFTGFWALTNLQSTMNAEGGIGVDSQAVVYLCAMVSCFFPEFLMEKFGTKTTFVICLLLGCPYIAANFKPRWDTMMISAVLFGLALGPLNASISVYTDEMSTRFKASSKESREHISAFFFGLNMFFAELTQIVGNTVSYYTLLKGHTEPHRNISVEKICGIHFDPNDPNADNQTNTNLDPPSEHDRHMITGIFLTLSLLSVVVAMFLDPLKNDIREVKGCHSVMQRITSAVKQLKNPQQLLLLPLTIYLGNEGSFYPAEFAKAFIACSWGVHHVGFVTICFGVCGALMAIFVGPLVKCISQMSVIILAAVLNVITCALLFVWQPSPDAPLDYFAFAGVWGMTDAIWWSQIAALYGLMFPNDREAAFSNFFFWSFLGFFLSYSYANYFTVAVKLNIMLVFLISGITLYVVGQVKIKCCSSRSSYVDLGDSE